MDASPAHIPGFLWGDGLMINLDDRMRIRHSGQIRQRIFFSEIRGGHRIDRCFQLTHGVSSG